MHSERHSGVASVYLDSSSQEVRPGAHMEKFPEGTVSHHAGQKSHLAV